VEEASVFRSCKTHGGLPSTRRTKTEGERLSELYNEPAGRDSVGNPQPVVFLQWAFEFRGGNRKKVGRWDQ
jgi:hypothetical protein